MILQRVMAAFSFGEEPPPAPPKGGEPRRLIKGGEHLRYDCYFL